MPRVEVGRYDNPEDVGGYTGWVCTKDWILFERDDGIVQIGRRGETGAVIGELVEV